MIVYILIMSYGYVRFMIMWNYDDTRKQDAYSVIQDTSTVYTPEDVSFEFAFWIVKIQGRKVTPYRPEEIEDYFSVSVMQKNTTVNNLGDMKLQNKTIETGPCTGNLAKPFLGKKI